MHHYQAIDAFIAEYGIELYLGFLFFSMVLVGLMLARHTLRRPVPPLPPTIVVIHQVSAPAPGQSALPPHLVSPPVGVGGEGSLDRERP